MSHHDHRAVQTIEYYSLAKNICHCVAFKFFITVNDREKLNDFGQINLIDPENQLVTCMGNEIPPG